MGNRIQVCGPLLVRLDGHAVESVLPGRQGRLLTAYLVVNRHRISTRDELVAAVWGEDPPSGAAETLASLLSRTRSALGADRLSGKSELRLTLPEDCTIDLEVALREVHRAESAVDREDWSAAWAPARAALHTATRGFLPGYDVGWVVQKRAEVETLRVRALEFVGECGLGLGGAELSGAERSGRALIDAAPFRETGYRLLMEYFHRRQEDAEALLVFEQMRTRFRDELGIDPSPAAQELYQRLLR